MCRREPGEVGRTWLEPHRREHLQDSPDDLSGFQCGGLSAKRQNRASANEAGVSMSQNDREPSKSGIRLILTAGVLAAMVIGMALMEGTGKPRPAQTPDTPAQRQ